MRDEAQEERRQTAGTTKKTDVKPIDIQLLALLRFITLGDGGTEYVDVLIRNAMHEMPEGIRRARTDDECVGNYELLAVGVEHWLAQHPKNGENRQALQTIRALGTDEPEPPPLPAELLQTTLMGFLDSGVVFGTCLMFELLKGAR